MCHYAEESWGTEGLSAGQQDGRPSPSCHVFEDCLTIHDVQGCPRAQTAHCLAPHFPTVVVTAVTAAVIAAGGC
jgi:hypothetical protein